MTWAGVYQGFQCLQQPDGTFPTCMGQDRQGCSLPMHPRTPCPGEGAEVWRVSSACIYLLSARSVLLPTSMMMTSLPLSVLTSSIHLEVCWKELRSGGGKWGQNQE